MNSILSENQLGTVRDCQGAREQAMISKLIIELHGNKLKTCWIDVSKAYDSVSHAYLADCLEALNINQHIIRIVKVLLEKWRINLIYNQENLAEVNVEKGILQGDSLSPILFVLCLEPLSKILNGRCKKVGLEDKEFSFKSNHLIFIDDIKLLAEEDEELVVLRAKTKDFLKSIGIEINQQRILQNVAT
jgi:Reverse transcriptase (RNA-dependent DNA polymerase)